MSMVEYARHRGCDKQLVDAAIKTGRITRGEDGLIDCDQADLDWERNTDKSQVRTNLKHRLRRDPQVDIQAGRTRAANYAATNAKSEEDLLSGTPGQSTALNFTSARAAREIFAARLLKVQLEKELGTLVDKRSVQLEAQNRGQVIRDAVLNIPDRLSAQLAGELSPAAVHEILVTEIRAVLDEFADGKLG